jgi:hypothetical protein
MQSTRLSLRREADRNTLPNSTANSAVTGRFPCTTQEIRIAGSMNCYQGEGGRHWLLEGKEQLHFLTKTSIWLEKFY